MRVLMIDDIRKFDTEYICRFYQFKRGDTIRIARTCKQGIEMLKNRGPWDLLLLDHDLGLADPLKKELNGYYVMCWLEQANPCYLPKQIKIISSNPVGNRRMQQVIDKLYARD